MIDILLVIGYTILLAMLVMMLINLITEWINDLDYRRFIKDQHKLIKIEIEKHYKKCRKEQK